MLVDFYGLSLDTPCVVVHLWSPWRASALEHKLFEAVAALPNTTRERDADESRLLIEDPRTWRQALNALARVLKGWQEDAEQGRESRGWRWLLEGDTDEHGYDHAGEVACLWGYLRVALDRGNLEEGDKGEDIDLNGFGLQFLSNREK